MHSKDAKLINFLFIVAVSLSIVKHFSYMWAAAIFNKLAGFLCASTVLLRGKLKYVMGFCVNIK